MNENTANAPTPRGQSDFWRIARMVLKPLASLQVTVALFALALVLVFFGTLAQKNAGIWTVVDKYFYSWFVLVDFQEFANFAQVFFGYQQKEAWTGAFPYPAGKLIGWAMFVNLMAAHILRFKLTWKRSGIFILHAGVVLLLAGEYVTREFQVEQRMQIGQGNASAVTFDVRDTELAFVTPVKGTPDEERVVVIPGRQLTRAAETGRPISHPDLPVNVTVLRWMPNTLPDPIRLAMAPPELRDANQATKGLGTEYTVKEVPEISGTEEDQIADMPAAFVAFHDKETNAELGRYLVAVNVTMNGHSEPVTVNGVPFDVSLRFTQYHKPFKLTLLKFTHERYLGTNLPKNFCSRVRIDDPEYGVSREVDISMNEPLRYRGEAFFQSGFDPRTEKTTILQVVRNPGWTLPYISCILVTLGMTVHFLIFLMQFLTRLGRSRAPGESASAPVKPVTAVPPGGWRYAGAAGAVVAALYLASNMFPANRDGKLDLSKLAVTPVVEGGRLKPLDSVARIALRQLNEREDVTVGQEKYSALKWYMEVASDAADGTGRVAEYATFRIQNLEVLSVLGLKPREGWRYTFAEIEARLDKLQEAAERADAVPAKSRTAFEVKVLETASKYRTFRAIASGGGAMTLPPTESTEWRTLASVNKAGVEHALDEFGAAYGRRPASVDELARLLKSLKMTRQEEDAVRNRLLQSVAEFRDRDAGAAAWSAVLAAYRSGNQGRFDEAVAAHQEKVFAAVSGGDRFRAKLELFLNNFAPYYHAILLYGFALAFSLLTWGLLLAAPASAQALRRATFWLVLVTFAAHTFTLLARMYLMERPLVFVTNLYSSAVFIGWVAAGVCLLIERIFPIGLGNLVASAIGLSTCIIGHNLAAAGDTLEMMRAVLDTNFWLATHVTTVTFGYAATYIAGVIGLAYIVLGLFTPRLGHMVQFSSDPDKKPQPLGKLIGQAMYGVICMAMLFSFVGTVLGGIWADQSWGRFWGWDPKENGAVMIVLWNALILHARWCGLVRNRGTAILSLVGNMITTWSWFGTNQLGVGLHAYGFSNELVFTCVAVWSSHLMLIAVALSVPPQYWRSDTSKA